MKRYIKLSAGERVIKGDEFLHSSDGNGEWRDMSHEEGYIVTNHDEGYVRRLVPHTGNVQFLMCVSILVPVIVNCDGREQESIEAEAGELAYQKVLDDPRKYINYDNVDWKNCKVDELQPEPKNPGKYRMLEDGEYFEDGDEQGMKDGTFKPLSPGAIGYVYDIAFGPYRRPITEPQHRPFVEGEVIEAGDQFRYDGNDIWRNVDAIIGYTVDKSVIDSGDFRKLIK